MSNFFTMQPELNRTVRVTSTIPRNTLRTKSIFHTRSKSEKKEELISKLLLLPVDHDIFFPSIKSDQIKKMVFNANKEIKVEQEMQKYYSNIEAKRSKNKKTIKFEDFF